MNLQTIDLNADLGEGFALDAQLMAYITSASIACGGHVGDAQSMRRTVQLARDHHVRIGAHPSYPDREHFGRRSMAISASALRHSVSEQIAALAAICADEGAVLAYVKPHGMLYNDAARDLAIADAVLRGIAVVNSSLAVMALAGSALANHAAHMGWQVINEGFVDRAYTDTGELLPRNQPGAVLVDEASALHQAISLAAGQVSSVNGQVIQLKIDSLCLHGDNEHALNFAKTLAMHRRLPK